MNVRIMPCFIKGQKVTSSWLKENFPKMFKNLRKDLRETETELDIFFLNLNRNLENNIILRRYRTEKVELIDFGKKLMEDLDREITRLKEELTKLP